MSVLFWLVLAHFAVDVTFQPDFVAKCKARAASIAAIPWYYVLASHAATHALAVGCITGSLPLAMLEFAAHFAIDWAKCEG